MKGTVGYNADEVFSRSRMHKSRRRKEIPRKVHVDVRISKRQTQAEDENQATQILY